jgi:hypothetical protein
MRGPLILIAVFAVVLVLATATRLLFLADVMPIADTEASQSMWALDAAFLLRSLENIAMLVIVIAVVMVASQLIKGRRHPAS